LVLHAEATPVKLEGGLTASPPPVKPETLTPLGVNERPVQPELTGKRRKMPLTGKAAMEAILGEAFSSPPVETAADATPASVYATTPQVYATTTPVYATDDGLDIPSYLRREPKQQRLAAKPEVFEAAKRIASGNGTKADKDKVRIEKLKAAKTVKQAELTGKRRKMPLTGKAAMEAILGEAIHGKKK
jgi:hypothetical protein